MFALHGRNLHISDIICISKKTRREFVKMNFGVELKKITRENIDEVLALKVSVEQNNFVENTARSLAKAWVYRNTAFPFAIYVHNTIVGFIMLGYYELKNQYTIWQFLIDERYQHKGYGKAALRLGIQFLIDEFDINEVYLGVKFQNIVAKKLYSSYGFVETGETTDTALEMKLIVSKNNEGTAAVSFNDLGSSQ